MDIVETTTWMQSLADNWEVITGAALVVIAGIDKVALICIRTLRNIRDSWYESFPKKEEEEEVTMPDPIDKK